MLDITNSVSDEVKAKYKYALLLVTRAIATSDGKEHRSVLEFSNDIEYLRHQRSRGNQRSADGDYYTVKLTKDL